jgi:hypothetical protein
MSKWLPYTQACYEHIHVRHLLSFAFLGDGARNACWHFLASLLRTGLGPIRSNDARNAVLASPNKDTKEHQPIGLYNYRQCPQAHGSIIVAFHSEVFRVSLFIFC